MSSLQALDKLDNYTLANGLEMVRPFNSGHQRTFTDFFVEDPTDFRWVQRQQHWNQLNRSASRRRRRNIYFAEKNAIHEYDFISFV